MKLSKLVGRNQLPGDEVAFNRLAKVFANPMPGPINSQRRKRVERLDGKTEISNKDEKK
jgi:hypothetical protein